VIFALLRAIPVGLRRTTLLAAVDGFDWHSAASVCDFALLPTVPFMILAALLAFRQQFARLESGWVERSCLCAGISITGASARDHPAQGKWAARFAFGRQADVIAPTLFCSNCWNSDSNCCGTDQWQLDLTRNEPLPGKIACAAPFAERIVSRAFESIILYHEF